MFSTTKISFLQILMPSVQKTQKQVAVARLSELSVDLSESYAHIRLLPDQLKKKKEKLL